MLAATAAADDFASTSATATDSYSGTLISSLPTGRWVLSTAGQWLPEQLLATPASLPNSLQGQSLSFGYTNKELWLWFELAQQPEQVLFLQLGSSFLDQVDLFYLDSQGQLVQQQSGDHIPFFQRPVLSRSLVLRLKDVEQERIVAYLLRVTTGSAMTLRPQLQSPGDLLVQEKNSTLLYGILFGLSLLAAVLALISWGWTRQSAFLTAAAYSLVFAWFHFTINGFDQQYLYPQLPALSDRMIGVSAFLFAALLLQLVRQFTPIRQFFPRLDQAMLWLLCAHLAGALASLVGAYPLLAPWLMLSGLLQMAVILAVMLPLIKHDKPVPLLFFAMLLPGWLALILQVIRNLGGLPYNFWTSHLWALSTMLQVVFLMLVLLVVLNREQQRLRQQLEENSALQRFYQLMAHELRTPLAVISSALTNLQWQTSTVPEAKPRIERARMAVARLNNLVDNALAEDRLHLLEQGLQLEPVVLVDWLAELQSLCLLTDKHQLVIPSLAPDATVWFDKQWLTLAVLNLLDNAVKYSPTGGTIELEITLSSEHWTLAVHDQGSGVATADIPQLFQRGFRARPHRAISGLGLGLHLVAMVVQTHGGKVWYQSKTLGSSFCLQLPVRPTA